MQTLGKGFVLSIILMLTTSSLQAETVSLKTMKDVQAKVEELLKTEEANDIMVVFDIDMTLTQPDHPAITYPALRKYVEIYTKILEPLSPEQKDWVSTLTTQLFPQKLVENDTPQIVQRFQKKGVRVIAFTASLSDPLSESDMKMIILRQHQLKKMGLDFTNSFPDLEKLITFSHFQKYANSYPLFYHGVLSANGEKNTSKGQVFCAFLDEIGDKAHHSAFHPKVVILIDDKRKHIDDVEAHLKKCDPSIQFIGIEYQGAFSSALQDISKEDFEKFWEDMANRVRGFL